MYEFHSDKDRYFDIQYRVTRDYIVPFLEQHVGNKTWGRVLEIGCAEAGVLKAFLEKGSFCTGIELSQSRIEAAEVYHADALEAGQIEFINRNIFDIDPENDLGGTYDLIILKDVIEHIPGQLGFIAQLPAFLSKGGVIFFAFPPWYMPYGGHQQVCKSKFLSKLPYFHLLPGFLYKGILSLFGEPKLTIEDLMEVKSTGITIEQFERYVKRSRLVVAGKQHYLFNPIYQYKFNVKPKLQNKLISRIPWLRNFFTTGVYYVVKPR